MANRLRVVGILTPPAESAWQPGVGYIRFEPADDHAANWAVPGYRPAWPILGVPNAVGGALQEINGGDVFVPGDEPGDTYAGPWMRVSYELQTTAGTWHRGTYLWRAVSTGGGVIDIRTPAPEQEPPIVARPGVPAGALLTTDVGNLVPSKTEFDGAQALVPDNGHPAVSLAAWVAPCTLRYVGSDVKFRNREQIMYAVKFTITSGGGVLPTVINPLCIGLEVGAPPAGLRIDEIHGSCVADTSDGLASGTGVIGQTFYTSLHSAAPHSVIVCITMSRG